MVKLFSKNSNLCDHNSPTSQIDGQTTCDRNTALCAKVHRAVIKLAHPCGKTKPSLEGLETSSFMVAVFGYSIKAHGFGVEKVKGQDNRVIRPAWICVWTLFDISGEQLTDVKLLVDNPDVVTVLYMSDASSHGKPTRWSIAEATSDEDPAAGVRDYLRQNWVRWLCCQSTFNKQLRRCNEFMKCLYYYWPWAVGIGNHL